MSYVRKRRVSNYRLIKYLGSGSAADVFLGEHIHNGNHVAIKMLNARLPYNEEELKLELQSEAHLVQHLEHPHIVKVLEFGFDDMTPFLIMDYAPNGSLRLQHPKGSTLPLITIISYVKQIADALQYAHDNKIIHCDLKPENILLGENNIILLSDFGTAQIVQTARSLTTQSAAGTPTYMAPEQFKGQPVLESDQYALGVIVYEWICGAPPFEGKSYELLHKHLDYPPRSLISRIPTLSPKIERVVMKALNKDPKMRFENVQVFAKELEQAIQSSQSITPAYQSFLELPRISRRKALLIGLGSGGGLIAAGGLIAGYFLLRHSYKSPIPPSFPPSLPGDSLYVYSKHSQEVVGIAWSPDGTRIASASYDRTVQVWDAANGSHAYTYRGHNKRVTCVSWSPNGKYIASGSDDRTVQVWDAANGSHIYTYRGHIDNVHSVAWSPDSERIVSGSSDLTVQIWHFQNGSNVLTHRSPTFVWTTAWSPDGTRIASGNTDSTVQVWDAQKGNLLFTYRLHSSSVHHVEWSPDGTRIASGSDDGSVQVWDAQNGRPLTEYSSNNNKVWTVAWSPDSTLIASGGSDKTVNVWDAQNGKLLLTYGAHSNGVGSVAWSPGFRVIASGSWDRTVRVWVAPSYMWTEPF